MEADRVDYRKSWIEFENSGFFVNWVGEENDGEFALSKQFCEGFRKITVISVD